MDRIALILKLCFNIYFSNYDWYLEIHISYLSTLLSMLKLQFNVLNYNVIFLSGYDDSFSPSFVEMPEYHIISSIQITVSEQTTQKVLYLKKMDS
jgi:hypothetical protein